MSNKIPGPLLKDNKPKMEEYIKYFSALGQGKASTIKSKSPRKPQAPRTFPNKRPEAEWAMIATKHLRKRGVDLKRIENSLRGKEGTSFPDWAATYRPSRWCGVIEFKSETGHLSEGQREFKNNWEYCRGNYILSRPGDYAAFDVIFKNIEPIDLDFKT